MTGKLSQASPWRRPGIVFAIAVGFFLEFFLIPLPPHPEWGHVGVLKTIFSSSQFYYALISPIVIWWWFCRFLRRKNLDKRGEWLAFLMFGFYLSSVLQALAGTIYIILHVRRS